MCPSRTKTCGCSWHTWKHPHASRQNRQTVRLKPLVLPPATPEFPSNSEIQQLASHFHPQSLYDHTRFQHRIIPGMTEMKECFLQHQLYEIQDFFHYLLPNESEIPNESSLVSTSLSANVSHFLDTSDQFPLQSFPTISPSPLVSPTDPLNPLPPFGSPMAPLPSDLLWTHDPMAHFPLLQPHGSPMAHLPLLPTHGSPMAHLPSNLLSPHGSPMAHLPSDLLPPHDPMVHESNTTPPQSPPPQSSESQFKAALYPAPSSRIVKPNGAKNSSVARVKRSKNSKSDIEENKDHVGWLEEASQSWLQARLRALKIVVFLVVRFPDTREDVFTSVADVRQKSTDKDVQRRRVDVLKEFCEAVMVAVHRVARTLSPPRPCPLNDVVGVDVLTVNEDAVELALLTAAWSACMKMEVARVKRNDRKNPTHFPRLSDHLCRRRDALLHARAQVSLAPSPFTGPSVKDGTALAPSATSSIFIMRCCPRSGLDQSCCPRSGWEQCCCSRSGWDQSSAGQFS